MASLVVPSVSSLSRSVSPKTFGPNLFSSLSRSGSPKTFGPNLCFKLIALCLSQNQVYRALALRKPLAERAHAAGLSPEIEKPNLLPARPAELGACEAGAVGESVGGGRRPADVFVPHWGLHGPAVFDLAVTSGLRCGAAAASAADGSHTCAAYEERKRSHLNTAALCRDQGLQFLPLIAESSCGGWGREAIKVWRTLGALLAAKSGDGSGAATEQLLQCLSVTLQRENARAVLRRLPDGAQSASTPLQNP